MNKLKKIFAVVLSSAILGLLGTGCTRNVNQSSQSGTDTTTGTTSTVITTSKVST
ncbi:MAG TPA: hypothetical protein PKI60_05435 [Oscillospiraceae bacterium]|nr:hypothetical protein [Oscillospiraceae bacterium]